jgi:DNA polymerase-1
MGQDLLKLLPVEEEFMMSLYRMMRRGIKVDTDRAQGLLLQGEERMSTIAESIGFRPSEVSQLLHFYLTNSNCRYSSDLQRRVNPPSTNPVMEEYELLLEMKEDEDPVIQQILEFRGWQKACSSFYSPYLRLLSPDGRLRCSFNMHGTKTGRLSSSIPNLQQIPRKGTKAWNIFTKICLIAEDGWDLIEFDYKTLEFRLAAVYAKDIELISRINDGQDLHQATVEMIKEAVKLQYERQRIKTTNFLKLYGGGRDKLALQLKVKAHKRQDDTCVCDSCVTNKAWNNTFTSMRRVMFDVQQRAEERHFVKYWTGRKKHYGTYWNKGEEHKAFNALCQGGGAEVTKNSLVRLRDLERETVARPVLTVHDSLVWEIRKDAVEEFIPQIREVMEDYSFSVKMEVDAHKWGEG